MRFAPIIFFITMCAIGVFSLLGKNTLKQPDFQPYPLPNIAIPLLDDSSKQLTNKQLPKDEPFLLHVFASWCPSCIGEHGYLLQLQGKYRLNMIGLGWNDTSEALTKWLNRYGDFYTTVALDEKGLEGIKLGITGTPETFLVRNNEVLYHHKGPITADIWQQKFAYYFQGRK